MLSSCSGISAESICTTIRPEFRVPTDLFLLYARNQKYVVFFHVIFFSARLLDQKLGLPLIFFIYVHVTIRPKYMVLFHLFFLLSTTIRPKIKVHTDLFLLFLHDHSTKVYGPLSFIPSFLFAQDHST